MLSLKDKTFKVSLKIFAWIMVFVILHLVAREIVFKPLAAAQKKYEDTQSKLSATEKLIKDYPGARDRTKELQAKIDALKEKSVSTKELPRIIQQLTKKSSELKMDIISIKPVEKVDFQEAKLPQGISKAYIEVVVRAPYTVLGEYLKAVKAMPIAFTVESVTIQRAADTGEAKDLSKDMAKKKDNPEDIGLVATMLISSYMIWQL